MRRRSSLIAGVLLLLAAPAHAVDRQTSEKLQGIDADLKTLGSTVSMTKANFTERRGLIGVADARRRYEDALYSYLVGDWEGAASSFYILVQSNALGSDALARDAEYYLAESLFEMDNYKTALEAWQAIIDRPGHPYTPDAVRRSLEVFGLLGDTKRFDGFYTKYIASGKVPATDVVNYTLAKSFYRRGERARSKSLFAALAPTSSWYSRGHYFLGVMMVAEENLDQAATEFTKAAEATATNDDARAVAEEAALALGRVYYEKGEFEKASTWYGRVPSTSKRFNEALYEGIWTHIKQEQWDEARREAATYLQANPEDRHTESLQLLIGHLHLKSGTWDNALAAYTSVSENYGSVGGRIDEVARDPGQVRLFLDRMQGGQGSSDVPGFAMDMLLDDDRTRRATDAWLSVSQQRRELDDCAQMIAELQKALASKEKELSSFTTARAQIEGMRGSVLRMYDRLLDTEAAWLRPVADSPGKTEIAAILADRDALAMQLFQAGTAGNASNERRRADADAGYLKLRTRLSALRSASPDGATVGAQIDKMWAAASVIEADVSAARGLVDAGSSREMDAVRSRLTATDQRVTELNGLVAQAGVKTSDTAVRVVRAGLIELRDEIASDVLAADKGIVDVYWIQKTGANSDTEQFASDQADQLRALDERYRRVRQNLGD